MDFMQWLNVNSGAIQALGSVAIAILTAVLAWITWQYVRLTREMLGEHLEAAAARRRELRTQANLLKGILRGLPFSYDERLLEAIRNCYDFQSFPYDRFRALASEVSLTAGSKVYSVETNLKWLGDLFHTIRSALPPRLGNELFDGVFRPYDWNKFPKREYETAWRNAKNELDLILVELDSFEKALPNASSE